MSTAAPAGRGPIAPSHLVHALWSGWLLVLLGGRSGVVPFAVSESPAGIVNRCLLTGYPKQQDYFWYAVLVLVSLAGPIAAAALLGLAGRLRWTGVAERWPAALGWAGLALSTALAFGPPERLAIAWTLLVPGAALPWLDRRWLRRRGVAGAGPPGPLDPPRFPGRLGFWAAAASLAVSFAWVYDGCLSFRQFDGMHEGMHLLFVQSALAGESPGLDVATQYGPLYLHSLLWWLKAFGLDMGTARGYFAMAQIAGTAAHLLLVVAVSRRRLPALTGAWLMLTLSTAPAIGFGWANAWRTALPLWAVYGLWTSLDRPGRGPAALSGLAVAASLLYSQEFGVAAGAAGAVMLGLRAVRDRAAARRVAAAWGCAILAGLLAGLLVMFKGRFAEAVTALAAHNSAASRLMGHGVLPLPSFPWLASAETVFTHGRTMLELVAIWAPGMLLGSVAAWRVTRGPRRPGGGDELLAGVAAGALLAQAPVIARPVTQIATSMPWTIVLVVLLLDRWWGADRAGRAIASVAALALAVYGAAVCWRILPHVPGKFGCATPARLEAGDPLARLGTVRGPSPRGYAKLRRIVGNVRELVPPGEPVYVAAPRYGHVTFLADRRGLAPFPLASLAVTERERDRVLAALKRERPRAVLLTRSGIDVPFDLEHPRELEWIQRAYELHDQVDDLLILARREP